MDLVVFESLLHDIEKTNDFKDFDVSSEILINKNSMALLGHSYKGTHIVKNYLSKYQINE